MPPQPKDPSQRARRNLESTAATIEAASARTPELGRKRPDGQDWRPETRAAWRAWWNERGIAERWISAYVPTLRLMALTFDHAIRGDLRAAAEFRMQAREFGLSVMAARSMGWRVQRPKEEPKRERPPAVQLPPGADPRKVLTIDSRRKAG